MSARRAKNEPFHSQESRTRRASDGVVFTAKRPNISFVTWNEKSFCRIEWDRLSMRGKQRIWLVVRNTLLSRQFESMSSKERCTRSHGIYGYYFVLTLNLYLFLNSKPSAISRSPVLAKKSPKLLCQILKNRSAYRWRNTVIVSVAAHIEIYIVLAGEQSVMLWE